MYDLADVGVKILIKKTYVRILCKIFGVGDWHLATIEDRPYASWIVKEVPKLALENNDYVIEIGCGLGEIIGNIRNRRKVAYDISPRNVHAARFLHPGTRFKTGSFDNISGLDNIGILIMVNFIHGIEPEKLRSMLSDVLSKADVKYVIFDTFSSCMGTEYIYSHEGEIILGKEYKMKKRSHGFKAAESARRYVEIWEKAI